MMTINCEEEMFYLYDENDNEVCRGSYEGAGIEDPHTDDDHERAANWEKIDKYIETKLGYLPEYE